MLPNSVGQAFRRDTALMVCLWSMMLGILAKNHKWIGVYQIARCWDYLEASLFTFLLIRLECVRGWTQLVLLARVSTCVSPYRLLKKWWLKVVRSPKEAQAQIVHWKRWNCGAFYTPSLSRHVASVLLHFIQGSSWKPSGEGTHLPIGSLSTNLWPYFKAAIYPG